MWKNRKYSFSERLKHPFSFIFKCKECKNKFLHIKSTSKYKTMFCSSECEDEDDNKMNTKPYGAYPYKSSSSRTATGILAAQQQAAQQAGIHGTVTFRVNAVTGVISTSVNDVVMPFTSDKIEQLKLTEPRKIGKKSPDYMEPIIAWRSWHIKHDSEINQYRLHGIGSPFTWEPMKMVTAQCIHQGNHIVPYANCTCGVWSFKELDCLLKAIERYTSTINVVGQVYIWGRVIETENGYRSQFAYPKELWILDETHEELGYNYNVPIRLWKSEISDKSDDKITVYRQAKT